MQELEYSADVALSTKSKENEKFLLEETIAYLFNWHYFNVKKIAMKFSQTCIC